LGAEKRVQQVTRQAIAANLLRSAHDCAEGGRAVALAESCLAGNRGAEIRFAVTDYGTTLARYCSASASAHYRLRRPGPDQDALLTCAEPRTSKLFLGQVKATNASTPPAC
jgi:phosphoribosylformylglycinamidine (FGAM) synthase-like enzyme